MRGDVSTRVLIASRMNDLIEIMILTKKEERGKATDQSWNTNDGAVSTFNVYKKETLQLIISTNTTVSDNHFVNDVSISGGTALTG